MSGSCLRNDGIEREMVVMCSLTVAVGAKAFPDGLVVVCLNVFVKESTFCSLAHKFLCPFEISFNDQLSMQTGQQRILQLDMGTVLQSLERIKKLPLTEMLEAKADRLSLSKLDMAWRC